MTSGAIDVRLDPSGWVSNERSSGINYMPLNFNKEELAYCAGLFDGEGHARYNYAEGKYGTLRIQVKMADLESLEKFKRFLFDMPTLVGPYKNGSKETNKLVYVCLIQNFEYFQFCICLLWNYLSSTKRKQLKDALTGYTRIYIAFGGA